MLSSISTYYTNFSIDTRTSILSALLVILFWGVLLKNKKKEYLPKLPGPKGYPILGNTLDILDSREKIFKKSIERCEKYGSIYKVKLGSYPIVILSDPEYIETVLHNSQHLRKGLAYKFVEPLLGFGLITSSGNQWLTHRKILTPAFHFKILDSFFDVFREQSKILIDKLDKKADAGKEFDIYNYIKCCALDVICETAMGVKVNSQSNTHSPYVQSAFILSNLMVERFMRPWLHPDFIFKMTNMGKEHDKHLKVAHEFVENVIQERKKIAKEMQTTNMNNNSGLGEEFKKRKLAFLDLLLDSAAKSPDIFTDKDIREEVDTFMFAGHDTVTAAITWTIYLTGLHPEFQEKLYQEQKEIFQDEMDRPIEQNDLTKMELLDRVMKESIRLYPSVPVISRTLDDDVKFGEYTVPKGSTVSLQIYQLHRNPKIYPEPEKFDPDRFLPENVNQRHNYAFVPFSAGPRNCIGKRFALNEEKFMLATLIRRYQWKSLEKPEDLNLVGELILKSLSGINVTLRRRETS